jgi:hypothetical protein
MSSVIIRSKSEGSAYLHAGTRLQDKTFPRPKKGTQPYKDTRGDTQADDEVYNLTGQCPS